MVGDWRHCSKKYVTEITRHEKIKILPYATVVVNKLKQTEDRKLFLYPILCTLCHIHQGNNIKTKFMQLRIEFNIVCQVLGWFLPCTWIRWVIRQCFRRVIWWRWGRGTRQNFDIFLYRMDKFLFLCVFHCGFAAFWYSVTCCSLSYKHPSQLVSLVLLILLGISQFISLFSKILLDVEDIPIFSESSSLNNYDAIRLPILDWPNLSY